LNVIRSKFDPSVSTAQRSKFRLLASAFPPRPVPFFSSIFGYFARRSRVMFRASQTSARS
jgi:hypothetical protein